MTLHHQHAHTQRTHRAGLEGREPNSLKSRAEPTPKEARNNPTNPRPDNQEPGVTFVSGENNKKGEVGVWPEMFQQYMIFYLSGDRASASQLNASYSIL